MIYKLILPIICLNLALVGSPWAADAPTVNTPVLRQPIAGGQVVSVDDIAILPLPSTQLGGNALLDPAAIVGKAAKHNLAPGRPLRSNDLQRPMLVQKGALVALNVNWPQIQLSTVGRAVDGGSRGDIIQVINLQSRKTVSGVVTDVNQVEVGMRPAGQ